MCLAAKTPSTIAQQKAATAPKLMKTMDATNWRRENRTWNQQDFFTLVNVKEDLTPVIGRTTSY